MVALPPILEGYVSKYIPQMALKLISAGTLTFDDRLVVHRMVDYDHSTLGLRVIKKKKKKKG